MGGNAIAGVISMIAAAFLIGIIAGRYAATESRKLRLAKENAELAGRLLKEMNRSDEMSQEYQRQIDHHVRQKRILQRENRELRRAIEEREMRLPEKGD